MLRKLRIVSPNFEAEEIRSLNGLLRREAAALGLNRSTLAEIRYLLRGCTRGSDEFIANACATFLTNRARLTGDPDRARWYRSKGIDLLDRLCDVGETPYQGVSLGISRAVRDADRDRTVTLYGGFIKRLFFHDNQSVK